MRFVVALVLALALAFPAAAHANLVSASPGANARLDTSPVGIFMTFTEPVEPTFSRIRLLDLDGSELLSGGEVDAANPSLFVLALDRPLPDGVYTVAWRVVSATDGHSTRGTHSFGIGMAAGTRAAIAIDEGFKPEAAAARWLDMIGAALTLGVAAFAAMVWRPGLAQGLPDREGRLAGLMRAGWVAAGLGLLAGLLAQASAVTGGSALAAVADGSAARLLTDSAFGLVWLGRAALWVVFGGLLHGDMAGAARRGTQFGLAFGFAILPSLVSHARAGGETALLNDMLHRTASALWVGGLAAWLAALWPDYSLRPKPIGRAVSRFSNLARFYVLLLAAGGLFAATQYIPTADALVDTGYGRALTVKGVLFGLMFALAAVNLLVIERRLRRGDEQWIGVLRVTTGTETMLGAALMVMSAVMATSVPARDVLTLRAQAAEMAALPQGQPFLGMEIQDDVMLHFEVAPGVAGENEFIVAPYLLPDALPIEDATRVRLRFMHLEQNLGESTIDAAHSGDGLYIADGANLSVPGRWRVRITLQRPGAFDTVTDFEVAIPLP